MGLPDTSFFRALPDFYLISAWRELRLIAHNVVINTMNITLTSFETQVAMLVGRQRQENNSAAGVWNGRRMRQRWGASNDYNDCLNRHQQGAAAEMAVAKALGVYWDMVVDYAPNLPDIRPDIEVRTTTRPNGSLIIHPEDDNNRHFYLVVGELPNYNVVGSILGSEAKQARWWRESGVRYPAYFVPQSALELI